MYGLFLQILFYESWAYHNLLSILIDRADTVVIGESNIGNVGAEKAFKNHNVYEICKETGAEIVNLSKIESKLVETTVQGEKIKIE